MVQEALIDERLTGDSSGSASDVFGVSGNSYSLSEPGQTPVESLFDPECYYNKKYASDQSLSTALINAYSGSALTQVLGAPITWPKDLSMMKWARAVMCYYDRDIPAKSNGDKWTARSDLYFFDAAVKYFKKFQYRWKYSSADCNMLKAMNTAIDNERTNIMQLKTAGQFGTGEQGHYLSLLKDLQNKIDNTLAELTCEKVLISQEQDEFAARTSEQLKGAIELTKSDKTAVYLIIGMIVIIVGTSGYMLFKK